MPVNPNFYRGMFRDSWKCSACLTVNFSGDKVCVKCGKEKPPRKVEIYDWRDRDGKVY